MPDLALQVAEGVTLEEPIWFFLETHRTPAEAPVERRQPLDHRAGFRELSGVRMVGPALKETSVTLAMARVGLIGFEPGREHLLELQFDGGRRAQRVDFRPELPLVFGW
jgi:hypothetical protein